MLAPWHSLNLVFGQIHCFNRHNLTMGTSSTFAAVIAIGNKNKVDSDNDDITYSIILESVTFLLFDSFSFKENGSIPDGSAVLR